MLKLAWLKSLNAWVRGNSVQPIGRMRRGKSPSTVAVEVGRLESRTLLAAAYSELIDPAPGAGDAFGFAGATVLTNGNVVVVDSSNDIGANDAGAVYLYNGATGALISTLRGSSAGDRIGSDGITALPNGNFLVNSPFWDRSGVVDVGAVTYVDGGTGLNGNVGNANSLVGNQTGDQVGLGGITVLSTGNYLVSSPVWDKPSTVDVGAVTFCSGKTGLTGNVNPSNSLVGSRAGDRVGHGGAELVSSDGIVELPNGNYLVRSTLWDNGSAEDAGAVTFGSGTTGVAGNVGAINSLVGTKSRTWVGSTGVTVLANGNYVVLSERWSDGLFDDLGAVTFGNGTTGVSGVVSSMNSLVGSSHEDFVGAHGVTPLTNGNYVVPNPDFDFGGVDDNGAVTWCDGTTGRTGLIDDKNSLVGSAHGDAVGSDGVTALTNGNYVVASSSWKDLDNLQVFVGAVTWGNGTTGTVGRVSVVNSLIGAQANDFVGGGGITALSNGNYVVASSFWDHGATVDAGAVTWGNGASGITGVVSQTNSLVGLRTNDTVGSGGVLPLTNGNYVVSSVNWDNNNVADVGAATWCDGAIGRSGTITSGNSLIGSAADDVAGSGGIQVLPNGNYVVLTPSWDNGGMTNVGAVTWGNGATGITSAIQTANSLYGTSAGDLVGIGGVTVLTNSNYVVSSPAWNHGLAVGAGAVTWASGTAPKVGAVSASNSLVGTGTGDSIGGGSGTGSVTALPNGNYVVNSPRWDNGPITDVGASTFGNGTSGTSGAVSTGNSLFGSNTSDRVGSGGIQFFDNGNYVVVSPGWNKGAIASAGAVTFAHGAMATLGAVTASNSATANSEGSLSLAGNLISVDNGNGRLFAQFQDGSSHRIRVGSTTTGFTNVAPTIGGAVANQAVNDNATINPFASLTVEDADALTLSATVRINNGLVRGDFTPDSVIGWIRSQSGNDIQYSRTFPAQANVAAVVQASVRAFVFQPRSNAVKPNRTETTRFNLTVSDGIAAPVSNTTTTVISTSVNDAPTLGGLSANRAVNDNATVNPFSSLTVSDVDHQEMLISVTILNGRVRGDFTNATSSGWTVRSTTGNDITYRRYFSPGPNAGASVQAAFRALTFQPRANAIKPGTTELTDFLVTVSDGVAPAVPGTGTRVTTTSVNDAPTISGAVANQAMNDNQTRAVFGTIVITDPDRQDLFARVTITNGVNRGDFTPASATGWTRTVNGANILYTRYFNAAANIGATVRTAVRALVFQPRANVPIGTTETTAFTLNVQDGSGTNATDATISVNTTGVAPRAVNLTNRSTPTPLPLTDAQIQTVVISSPRRKSLHVISKPGTTPLSVSSPGSTSSPAVRSAQLRSR